MTVIMCPECNKVIKPGKPTHRPYLVFYINQPCEGCGGKIDLVKL